VGTLPKMATYSLTATDAERGKEWNEFWAIGAEHRTSSASVRWALVILRKRARPWNQKKIKNRNQNFGQLIQNVV